MILSSEDNNKNNHNNNDDNDSGDKEAKNWQLRHSRRYVRRGGIVFFIMFAIIFERNLFQKIEVKITNLLKEKRNLEAYIIRVELEERFLYRPERVDNIAQKVFKMRRVSADKVKRIIIDEPN
ncbi:MAG: cell division protein FtsL [SAR324 cluster bacterium]|nr:cell division protein FtsL [SAR324 cluster bacterium]